MLNIANEMEQFCPEAYLLQASNPVLEGCTLISRATDIQVLGICHGHYGYQTVAATIGLNPNDVTFEAVGLNHCIWLTQFIYEQKNAYPLIDEWIETQAEEYWRTHTPSSAFDTQMSRAAINQYQLYGLFPIGDTVRWGGWWYHTNFDVKKKWYGRPWGGPDTEVSRPFHVAELSKRIKEIQRVVMNQKKKVTETYIPQKTREQYIPKIDAIVNKNEGRFQVNVPNSGTLEGLPEDVVVEVPTVITHNSIKPDPVGTVPKKLMLEQLLPRWIAMEYTLETYHSGDRSM